MALISRIIEIGISAVKARTGARQVQQAGRTVVTSMNQMEKATTRFERSQNRLAMASSNLSRQLQGFFSTAIVAQQVRGAVSDLAEFELAIIGIGKTTDTTGPELDELGSHIDFLSRRMGIGSKELANYARFAGQMGIRGNKNLLSFAETVGRLSITLDDLDPEEAARELAQFLLITDRPHEDIVDIGNAVTKLGNDFAATEDQIIRASVEVAKALRSMKVSAEQSLAFGTTLATMRVRPELASTTIGRMFRRMNESVLLQTDTLATFAKVAGLTEEEFSNLWSNDKFRAVLKFTEGIKELGEQGTIVLEQVGLGGDEAQRVIPALAAQMDILTESYKKATDQTNLLDESTGELYRESNRVLESLQYGLNRISMAFSSGRRSILEQLFGTDSGTKFVNDFANAIELVFRLEGSLEYATDRSIQLAVALKAVGLAIATIVGLTAISFVVSMGVEMAKTALAVGTLATAIMASLIPALLLVGAAVVAIEIGRYFHDEFKIVQKVAATAIAAISELIMSLKWIWRDTVLGMGDLWEKVLGGISLLFADFLTFLGEEELAKRVKTWVDGLDEIDMSGVDKLGRQINHALIEALSIEDKARAEFQEAGRAALEAFAKEFNVKGGAAGLLLALEGPLGDDPTFLAALDKINQDSAKSLQEFNKTFGATSAFAEVKQELLDVMGVMDNATEKMQNGWKLTEQDVLAVSEAIEKFRKIDLSRLDNEDLKGYLEGRKNIFQDLLLKIQDEGGLQLSTALQKKLNQQLFENEMKAIQETLDERWKEIEEEFGERTRNGEGFISDFVSKDLQMLQEKLEKAAPQVRKFFDDFASAFLGLDKIKALPDDFMDIDGAAKDAAAGVNQSLEDMGIGLENATRRMKSLNERMVEMLLNIERQKKTIGLSNETKRVDAETAKFAAIAYELYGNNVGKAEAAVNHFRASLEELTEMERMEEMAKSIGDAFSNSFEDAIFNAEKLSDVLNSLGREIARLVFQQTAGRAVSGIIGNLLYNGQGEKGGAGGILGSLLGPAQAHGGVWSDGIQRFASGGVVGSATMFGHRGGLGVMGEAGPEAIMPLTRTSNGDLGVKVEGGNQKPIVIHNHFPPGTDVQEFKRSRRQIQSTLMAATTRVPRS